MTRLIIACVAALAMSSAAFSEQKYNPHEGKTKFASQDSSRTNKP